MRRSTGAQNALPLVGDARRRGYAVPAFNTNGGTYDIARAALEDAEPAVRDAAAFSLGRMGSRPGIQKLVEALAPTPKAAPVPVVATPAPVAEGEAATPAPAAWWSTSFSAPCRRS